MDSGPVSSSIDDRAIALLDAQNKAVCLFAEIEGSLIRPGITESLLSREIFDLAAEKFGVTTHWHKRVIRAGANTLQPYSENPPDLMIQQDDILFIDLGPVFAAWEADFGRTFVLGDDPVKHRLKNDLEPIFRAASAAFNADPDMNGAKLYSIACDLARAAGWEFGGKIAGHTVGEFPHETIPGDRVTFYITRGNTLPLRRVDAAGRPYHWILEIHLVDRNREIGGFFEELLTVGTYGAMT
jgi:Xaa-Pro aminopeptidase